MHIVIAGISQIAATALMVQLYKQKIMLMVSEWQCISMLIYLGLFSHKTLKRPSEQD